MAPWSPSRWTGSIRSWRVGGASWSAGGADELSDPEDLIRAGRLGLRPTAPGERPFFVRIRSELVSGRRFLSPAHAMAASFGAAEEASAV